MGNFEHWYLKNAHSMTPDEINRLLHKALQFAPDRGGFPLVSCVGRAMDNERDDEKLLKAFKNVKELFLAKYGRFEGLEHSQFFKLNDSGRKLKSQPLS